MATRGNGDVGRRLMIKYGLPSAPLDSLITLWTTRTNQLIREGTQPEAAGRTAAAAIFTGFQTHVYASEADDITSLLDAARNR